MTSEQLARNLGVSQTKGAILQALYRAGDDGIPGKELACRFSHGPESMVVRVLVWQLRQQLGKDFFVSGPHIGYRLSPKGRRRLQRSLGIGFDPSWVLDRFTAVV